MFPVLEVEGPCGSLPVLRRVEGKLILLGTNKYHLYIALGNTRVHAALGHGLLCDPHYPTDQPHISAGCALMQTPLWRQAACRSGSLRLV